MKKITIPAANLDLKSYAKNKNLKYLLGYIAFCAFFAAAFVFFAVGRYDGAPPLKWWVYPLYALAVLVGGWYVCCMNRFVSDKSISGRVKNMSFVRNFDRGLSRKAGFNLEDHTYIKMTLTDPMGKDRKLRVQLFEDGYDGYYKEGGTVVKFRGLNYPLCLESEKEGAHICSVCGVRTYYSEGKAVDGTLIPEIVDGLIICRSCGRTLINVKDLEDGEK